ncbi:hypothetical protein, partial [Mesorhizobium sp.]|uniref:hypothetical protein n=2 Tax=Mesorhizobium TaxID=68287 RepID=UPI00263648E0
TRQFPATSGRACRSSGTRRVSSLLLLAEANTMPFSVTSATSDAILEARNTDAEILGVVDLANKTDAKIGTMRLGQAIQFVANASVLGYGVRGAMVFYGKAGTPSLRARECEQLWALYGFALLEP